jgi:hypothetical protein
VLRICGDVIYLEMKKKDGTLIRQEWGPFDTENARLTAHRAATQLLFSLNAGPPEQYTNRWGEAVNTPGSAVLLLDAEFSEDPTRKAVVSRCDVANVLRAQWGAKQLSDGSWYAFTDNPLVPARTLHDYLLVSMGRRLVRFRDGNALNCVRENMESCPPPSAPAELIEIDASEPDHDGNYKGLCFQNGSGSYPHGRWRLKWKLGGQPQSTNRSLKSATSEEKERVKQQLLLNRARLIETMNSQSIQTWAEKHPETSVAAAALPVSSQQPIMRNSQFQFTIDENGFNFGSHLRGRVSQHGRYKWCIKAAESTPHEHFDDEHSAMHKLLQLNSAPPYSINAWQLVEGGARKIRLDGAGEDAFMLVDDDPDKVDALSEHVWCAHPIEGEGDAFEVRNLDASSQWKRAIDVIAFQTLRKVRRRGGRAVVATPADYFANFTTTLLTADHRDLRSDNIGSRM